MINGEVDPFVDELSEALVGCKLTPDFPDLMGPNEAGRASSLMDVAELHVGAVFLWGLGILATTSFHPANVVLTTQASRSHFAGRT